MKKTFPLHVAGKDNARVLEAVKNDVRKYLKRERRKAFPEGFDLWDFDCKIGPDQATATVTPVVEVIPALDRLAASGATQAYVEILAFASNRQPARVSPFDQPDALTSDSPPLASQPESPAPENAPRSS